MTVSASQPSEPRLDRSGSAPCLRLPLLEVVAGFRHAFSTRRGGSSAGRYGSLNLGLSVGDETATVLANRARAAKLVGVRGLPATVRQMHGIAALCCDGPSAQPGEPLGEADMIATATPDVALLVQAADCAPIVVIDPAQRAAAAVHAGWRGVAAGAGGAAVASMQRLFGSRAADLQIGIGPSIGVCCYEVGDEVATAIDRAAGVAVSRLGPRGVLHTDLRAALLAQFVAAGVPPQNIASVDLCTACRSDLFYSHRREGEPTGRFGALVAIA